MVASTAGAELSIPQAPSVLAQVAYQYLAVEGWGAMETSRILEIPLEQLGPLRREVEEWLIRTMPRSRLSPADQRAAIEKLTVDRLEHLYSEATEAWRESKREQTTVRRAELATTGTATTTRRFGQASLLTAAARIVTLLGKFQLTCLAERKAAVQRDATHGKTTLDRDCSVSSAEQGAESGHVKIDVDASDNGKATYIENVGRIAEPTALEESLTSPVQLESKGGTRGVSRATAE